MHCGPEIFPPVWDNIFGPLWRTFHNNILDATFHRYSKHWNVQEFLGDRILGESSLSFPQSQRNDAAGGRSRNKIEVARGIALNDSALLTAGQR